jgi:nitrogen fixation-related uncharacterized protein
MDWDTILMAISLVAMAIFIGYVVWAARQG